MAWFTSSSSAPKVQVAKSEIVHGSFAIATATSYSQTETTVQYEKRGMTSSAADSYVTAQASAGNNPQKQLIGGGGYNVKTTERTLTAWTEDT